MPNARDAIILVHGIGDRRQRSTLDAFLAHFRQFPRPEGSTQILRTPANKEGIGYFDYVAETANVNGRPVAVAEMFWSELTTLETGILAGFRNFFKLIANAPDVIYATLGPRLVGDTKKDYVILRLLRSAVAFSFWTIYFPIMAYYICYAALFIGFVVHYRLREHVTLDSSADPQYVLTSVLTIGLLFLLARFTFVRAIRPQLWMAVGGMVILLAVATAGWVGVSGGMTYRAYTHLMRAVGALWFVPIGFCILTVLLLPILILFFRERRRGLFLGYAAFFLSLSFWGALFTAVWLVIFRYALDPNALEVVRSEITVSVREFGLIWFEIVLFAITFAVVYLLHRARSGAALRGEPVSFPRLLVPPAVLALAVLMTAVWVYDIVFCFCAFKVLCDDRRCSWLDQGGQWILAHVGWLTAIGGLILTYPRTGLKLWSDIVSFFRHEGAHRNPNPLVAMGSVFKYDPESALTFRNQLRDRLQIIVDDTVGQFGPLGKLSIVAHSLGSMSAVDVLRRKGGQYGFDVTLVTMGSPYLNFFRHYFPHMFPELGNQTLPNLEISNVYRSDDYVGTLLSRDESVVNAELGPKGHEGYFEDGEALSKYRDLL